MSQITKILGKITLGSGSQQITTSNISCYAIILQAPSGNVGNIYIGDSTVTTVNGIFIGPGDDLTVTSQGINNYSDGELILSDFYVIAANPGDAVVVQYLTVKPRS